LKFSDQDLYGLIFVWCLPQISLPHIKFGSFTSYSTCVYQNYTSYTALYPRQQPWFKSDNPLFMVQ